MHSACGRYVIVFNGEIYNHLDLRRALQAVGGAPAWRGHSDTETLLAGIACWGLDETLRRSRGMFAIALWDRQAKILQLARDRLGEKPLYWGWCGQQLVFASELKALRAHPDFNAGVCPQALIQYFRFNYVPAPRSIHPGIYKLEPGTILQVSSGWPTLPPAQPLRPDQSYGSIHIRRYWFLNDVVQAGLRQQIASEADAIQQLENTLAVSVQRQMLADVPLGAFLSGGIDSSTIVALMQRHSVRPVKTFTIGFDRPGYDESGHAAAVARHLGTDHTMLKVTDTEAREVIPALPRLYDEPFADSSQIPTHLVARVARQQVTVALSGDGGDELFGGYNRYFWGTRIWRKVAWLPHPLRMAVGHLLQSIPVSAWDTAAKIGAALGAEPIVRAGDKAHKLGARLRTVKDLDGLYRSLVSEWTRPPQLLQQQTTEPVSLLDDPLPEGLEYDAITRMMVQDLRTYLPDDILCKVDRAAMGVSLETRAPFLDADVVELAFRLPLTMKIRAGQGKWAVRQVLYRYVPRELIERPKMGFGIPVGEWLRGPLRPWADELLSHGNLQRTGLLNPEPIQKVWAEHLSGRRDWTTRLWGVLMFQAWSGSIREDFVTAALQP
ncbi:asparagine synthase (glutamine-hydrolysing) [Fontimonas thermophila]|uniref:asparagine synthase (glutamine-hydrolyzing) n=2 Tax=Fontimonas thermophila TaxID=1076937 RepID=A0A1I2IM01_9GAMM|nr:asparagine synthase (glutamine-hydrolysing) [Fontimonas thermophila]